MTTHSIKKQKEEIIRIGKLLWDKDLASATNGNISMRLDDERILLTAHGTCLGLLAQEDILLVDLEQRVLEGGNISTEALLHTGIYKNFPQVKSVVHTHTSFTNAFFTVHDRLIPRIFETKVYLGEIKAVEQHTPSVTDVGPVIEALRNNNVAVLRNHGTVAMGENLLDCFYLVQSLEEAAKIDVVSRLYRGGETSEQTASRKQGISSKKFKMFSQEQMEAIVKLVNEDSQLKELGAKTQMTMNLAVKLNETGQVFSFRFENGHIESMGHDEGAEFVVSAPESVWRAVFSREIDPFVATTQKKMDLKGDFARISKFYAPCSRLFELWAQVPVE